MSSFGNVQVQYDWYFFLIYGRFGNVTGKSHGYKTLRGAKTKATIYLYDYIGNHTNREIADNCVSVSVYSVRQPKKPICTKFTESLERWEYHD